MYSRVLLRSIIIHVALATSKYWTHRLDASPELLYAVQPLLAIQPAGVECKSFCAHKESFWRGEDDGKT